MQHGRFKTVITPTVPHYRGTVFALCVAGSAKQVNTRYLTNSASQPEDEPQRKLQTKQAIRWLPVGSRLTGSFALWCRYAVCFFNSNCPPPSPSAESRPSKTNGTHQWRISQHLGLGFVKAAASTSRDRATQRTMCRLRRSFKSRRPSNGDQWTFNLQITWP